MEEQYDVYVHQISTRTQDPAKESTLAQYHHHWRNWIHPAIRKAGRSPQVHSKQPKIWLLDWFELLSSLSDTSRK